MVTSSPTGCRRSRRTLRSPSVTLAQPQPENCPGWQACPRMDGDRRSAVGTGRAGCLCWQPLQGRSTLMNQADLIAAVAAHASLNNAGKAVEALVGTITGALKRGEEIRIAGFGTFGISERGGPQFS